MTSDLCENEAKNFQNGNVHLAQIHDFWIGWIPQEPFDALRSVRAQISAFLRSFI